MHIALFTDCFDLVNGVCTTYKAFANELIKTQTIQLTLFTPAHTERVETYGQVTIVRMHPTVTLYPPNYSEFQSGLVSFGRINRYCHTKPDLVHIATPGPFGIIGGLWARYYHIPSVGFYHTDMRQYGSLYGQQTFRFPRIGSYVGNRLAKLFNQLAYGACSLMFVQTESYLEEAQSIAHCPVHIIPTGINTNLFLPPSPINNRKGILRHHYLKNNQYLAIFVGRLALEKNIPFLLSLYPQLQKQNIQLVLVGDGPMRAAIPPHIPVTGYLGEQQLLDAYHSADLLILPSHTDTIGLVVLEAMACGLPVVCSPFGGPAEVVQKTGAGAICDTADSGAFAQTCSQLVTHRSNWLTSATKARAFGQTCSHARSVAHMIQSYQLVAVSTAVPHLNLFTHTPGL